MTVKFTRPSINIRETLDQLNKPSGIAGNAMLAADTPQEQFNLIGAGRKNLIINGGFDVWQRGTTGSVVGGPEYVSADRWKLYVNASTTIYLNQQSFDAGQTEVPGNPKYYGRFDWLGTGNSQFFGFEQLIEGVSHGAGDTLTVSFYARTEFGDDITLGVNQKFGSGGSADVGAGNFDLIMDTTWKKFIVNVPMPSISGKTIGGGDSISMTWYRQGTLNSYLEIANVQVEVGKVATPFEHRSYGEELALCQRYYYRLNVVADTALMIGNSLSTSVAYYTLVLPRPLRGVPTVNQSGFLNYRQRGASTNVTTTVTLGSAFYSPGNSIVQVQTSSSGLPNTVEVMIYSSTGNTGYIEVDAEL